ncbi:DUF2714 domain-containing protein [Mycoplasma capricolum]|uniref:DUF2714 domain-containing protein n=2 Tax=Mycoplasma capricolum subsp. capricolum TaxID=40479 RepID=Q2SSC5_MYCCT|nr:DUF2714 domain-containing protein [Mycoplasma capricolum]ABC01736.1 conserved hypothetical protein [Mycoplasma capricolum subsp. capricolum ATCC 27343]KEZ20957.1 Hypothetical protein, DUF2714 family [Mycoplasma capricolum subsp. capricolum 14232]KKW61611.1 hypothetical protein AAK27_438 [Mycoplasma capricolum subsp. capricolum]MCK8461595.1 DUF2714 domain-containing protein [Mycoplasma capricolum subsp. capricolum]
MKHKNKQNSDQSFIVFDLYEQIVNANNYIDYQKLLATVLLENQIGFDSKIYKEFENSYLLGLKNHYDLVLRDFVITFNVNLKISSDLLVPMISASESSNTDAINLKQSKNEQYNKFLNTFNDCLISLIKQDLCVEIFPKIIIFKSKNTDKLKIIFDKTKVLTRG